MGNYYEYMRVLVRKAEVEKYLQPSGDWGDSRDTAREFPRTTSALEWLQQKNVSGAEVLLAFDNPRYDVPSFRV